MTTDHSARELTEAAQDTARRRVAHFCDVFKHIPDDGKVGIGLDGPGFLMGDLRALLAESVPAGWKLVPVDPTQEMRRAGRAALDPSVVSPSHVWRMMLLAAPGHGQEEGR